MFKYLERLLGKPMKYYENLMASRKERVVITASQKQTVKELLAPHVLEAYSFESLETIPQATFKNNIEIPQNKKGTPLPCKGIFKWNEHIIYLFVNDEAAIKDSTNYELIIKSITENTDIQSITHQKVTAIKSLPIWEEVIHRFPSIHKSIVRIHPEHPWTLYKETVKDVVTLSNYKLKLGGYPMWRVNDMDYRKIEKLEFILEYRIIEKDFSIYFFKDPDTNEINSFKQQD